MAEVEGAALILNTPAARLIAPGEERLILLEEVEALLASGTLVVDACRHVVRDADTVVSLTTRPVLFALARALGEAWPADVSRSTLLAKAFRAKHADESHRARLRVEVGRLRSKLKASGGHQRDDAGLCPGAAACPQGRRAGAAGRRSACHGARLPRRRRNRGRARHCRWRSGASARTVQRALERLATAGKVQSYGRGRARRWMTRPVPGFTTTLLLPGPLPRG